MLLFGHLGVTLGIFFLLGFMIPRLREFIDFRYLALGSMLPDIIDKPLGKLIFAQTLANGRIIGHTLLFSLSLALLGFYIYWKKRNPGLLACAAGSFLHLLEDGMWANPSTFFWPLLGWNFPRGCPDYTGWAYFARMFKRSFEPELSLCFISELLGMIVIIFIIAISVKKRIEER